MNIFCEIPCLTERSSPLLGSEIQKKWFQGSDKRIIGQYLQKFISYNRQSFQFVSVDPQIIGEDRNVNLVFRTSSYIGTVPLRSPITGKQIGDLIITPRFINGNDYIQILDFLGNHISPEYFDGIPLLSGKNFRPPIYIDAIKFIRLVDVLIKTQWTKFANIKKYLISPSGQVDWNKYISDSWDPNRKLNFPSNVNTLNEFHFEYSQIKYVYSLCKKEINSNLTPFRLKASLRETFIRLDTKLYSHPPISVNKLIIKNSDTKLIKEIKLTGNKFLSSNISDSSGWRIDFSDVFEKLVQKIFQDFAVESGFSIKKNIRFQGVGTNLLDWSLRYLEPDLILSKNDKFIFVDAKYKSHFLNKKSKSNLLKEEHRSDLHQIFAYCSFDKSIKKIGILCYPSHKFEWFEKKYQNPLNNSENTIKFLGVPLNLQEIKDQRSILHLLLAS